MMIKKENYNETESFFLQFFIPEIKDKIINYAFYTDKPYSIYSVCYLDYFKLGYYEKCKETIDYLFEFNKYEKEVNIGISIYLHSCKYIKIILLILSKINYNYYNIINWTKILENNFKNFNNKEIFDFLLNKINSSNVVETNSIQKHNNINLINWNYILKSVCAGNSINMVKYIIKKMKDLNLHIDWYYAILGTCEGGNIDIFKYIISNHIPLFNSYDWNDFLYKAYENNNYKIIKFLDRTELYFKFPLVYYWKSIFKSVCRNGNICMIKYIIKKYPILINNNVVWKLGINEALKNNNITAYKFMMQLYISQNTEDILIYPKVCRDLFSIACENGYLELFNLILKKVEKINNLLVLKFYIFNTISNFNLACKGGNIKIILFLLNKLNVSKKYKKILYNKCMISSCKLGYIDVIEILNNNF